MSYVDGIREEFLFCRDFLHAWDPYNVRIARNKVVRRNEVHEILLCSRCGAQKTRVMTSGGEILRNSYVYPDGYLVKDQGQMTPADRAMIRITNMKKLKKELE